MNLRASFIQPDLKDLSVRRQCELLKVSRSKLYYKPVGETAENLQFMQIIDKHLMEHPAEGVLSIVNLLSQQGFKVNAKRIRRLFRQRSNAQIRSGARISATSRCKRDLCI